MIFDPAKQQEEYGRASKRSQGPPVDASPWVSTDPPPEDKIKKSAEAAKRRKETEDEVQDIAVGSWWFDIYFIDVRKAFEIDYRCL